MKVGIPMKKLIALLLALTLLLSLCACEKPVPPDSSETEETSSVPDTQTDPTADTSTTGPTETTAATDPTETTVSTEPTFSTDPTDPVPCQHQRSRRETAATCTQPGQVIEECILCGDVMTEEIPATGHRFADATCTKAKMCTLCGITDGTAPGHSYQNGKCTLCGTQMPGYEEKPTGCSHNYQLSGQTAPTCTEKGSFTYSCTKCGGSYSETVAPNGHSYTAATCQQPKTCTVCNDTSGNPLAHSYQNGKCTLCGAADPDAPITVNYQVTVRTDKGVPVEGVTVSIYTTGSTPAATGKTNSKGVVIIPLEPCNEYTVTLANVSSKYAYKESYRFTYHIANINLTTIPVISPTDHSQANYKVGSTMGDFTLTDTDGNSYNLYTLLKGKELVLLDFWYVSCVPCKSEFPYFETIYKQYGDRIQLLTLDPLDSEDSIKQLRQELGFTFPMIRDNIGLYAGFGVKLYPTMVFIDSTGKILKIEVGAYQSEQELIDEIERFL